MTDNNNKTNVYAVILLKRAIDYRTIQISYGCTIILNPKINDFKREITPQKCTYQHVLVFLQLMFEKKKKYI